ncbi:hypothetical protein HUK80_15495 [Flavobacterium sp. MAH-1]|uniref:Lipoprotein n=1 Tax=Flavobacterium agri TaxID=2743471 RepID=A0A7Y9C8C1_9FLAO|nr:hypothetical protein [Flavobacterium agri]NUY82309.1 hypothetical protein [Flavobacterium agri]NYA72333.1 hypothetical protein [Flavobacterium agri]
MRKKIFAVWSWGATCLTMVGCMKSKDDRIRATVIEFNKLSPQIRNEVFRNAEAEASNDTIKISFVLNAYPDEVDKPTYNKVGPAMLAGMVKQLPDSESLLDEGVKFQVIYMANDGTEILNKVLGKSQIVALTEDKSRFFNANSGKPIPGSKSRLAPDMKESLRMMNQNLPIVDKEAGTSVTRIDVNEKNELVYTVEVTDELADALTTEGTLDLVREEIIQDPNLRRMFPSILRMGIEVVHYEYVNKKGKLVADVRITQNDL